MSKLRVSIIGLGRIAEHYLNILNSKNFNNVILSSVCDKKKNILNKFLKKNKKISLFSDLNSLLNHLMSLLQSLYLKITDYYL